MICIKSRGTRLNGKTRSVPAVARVHSWPIMGIDTPVGNVDTPNGRVVPESVFYRIEELFICERAHSLPNTEYILGYTELYMPDSSTI